MSIQIREYTPADEAAVVALWRARDLTRPWNDPHADVARAYREFPTLLLVAEDRVAAYYAELGYTDASVTVLGKRLDG